MSQGERLRGGRAVDAGGHGCLALLHQNHCQSTEECDGFLPFQPGSKVHPGQAAVRQGGPLI